MYSGKKVIILGISFLLSLSLLIICLTYSLVIFQNGDDDASVSVSRDNGDQKAFTMRKGTTKWVILHKGNYNVFATDTAKSRESLYSYSLGAFSKRTIDLEVVPQKQSEFLGKSSFDCSASNASQAVFFPCTAYAGIVEATNSLSTKTVSLAKEQAESEDNASSYAMRPYRDGLLSIRLKNKVLSTLSTNVANPDVITEKAVSTGFGGSLKNNYFATTTNGSFAIFDSSTKAVLIYKSLGDASPKKISFDKYLSGFGDGKDVLIALSDKTLFVVLADDVTESSDNILTNTPKEDVRREASEFGSTLFSANLAGNAVEQFTLPDNAVADSLSVDASGGLVIFSQYPDRANVYRFSDGKFLTLDVPADINYACAFGNYIYFNTTQNKIYRYSTGKRGAFLVYRSNTGEITNLNCSSGGVAFGIASSDEGEDSTLRYRLVEKDQEGPRLDGILPIYYTLNADSYVIEQSKNGVLVRLEYDSNKNGPSPKDILKKEVMKQLKERVNITKEPTIGFGF